MIKMPYIKKFHYYVITCNMCKIEATKKGKTIRTAWINAIKSDGFHGSVYLHPWLACLCPKCNNLAHPS